MFAVTSAAVADSAITEAAVDTWRRFWGFGGPPIGRKKLAEQAGVSVTAIYQRRRRVATLLAAKLATGISVPAGLGRASPLHPEVALATVHAGLMVDNAITPARLSAIFDLRRRELGHSVPAQFSAVDKHARRRARLYLGQQFQQLRRDGLVQGAAAQRRLPADEEAAAQVAEFDARYCANDSALPDALLDMRRRLWRSPGLLSAPVEARLWEVQARIWREDEDIGTIWAAQRVRALVGDVDPASIATADDAAIVLTVHGYLAAAADVVNDASRRVPWVRCEPEQRRQLMISLLTRQALIRARLMLASPRPGDVAAAHRCLDTSLRLLEGHAGDPVAGWDVVVSRRRLEVMAAAAVRERRREGYRRGLVLPKGIDVLLDNGDDQADRASRGLWRFTWHLAVLQLSVERNDPDMFQERLPQIVGMLRGPWLFMNQVIRLRSLFEGVAARPERAWRAVTMPDLYFDPVRTPEHWGMGTPLTSPNRYTAG